MRAEGKVVVVTGGASGIGAALCRRFAGERPAVVVAGVGDERFLLLPHPAVAEFVRRKAADPDRWLAGMRRLVAPAGG